MNTDYPVCDTDEHGLIVWPDADYACFWLARPEHINLPTCEPGATVSGYGWEGCITPTFHTTVPVTVLPPTGGVFDPALVAVTVIVIVLAACMIGLSRWAEKNR